MSEDSRATIALDEAERRVGKALALIVHYGKIDSGANTTWVIDQVVRVLTGDGYTKFIADACCDEDGQPGAYSWDVGVPP